MINTMNTIKKNVYNKVPIDTLTEKFLHMSNTLYEKDKYTFEHCKRVAYYSSLMGKELNLLEKEMEWLITGALFHDLGKIVIPKKILNKPGALSVNELKVMRSHPETSAMLLKAAGTHDEAVSAALYHHERYDGTGYLQDLKGKEIPLLARIMSVADSYDAMTTNRSYSRALENEEALEEIYINKESQFDPDIADVFIDIMYLTNPDRSNRILPHTHQAPLRLLSRC